MKPSHPTRMRGLKFFVSIIFFITFLSHPTRMRGLKSMEEYFILKVLLVASHADAWIEIIGCEELESNDTVASHADAWIEIILSN